LACCFNTFAEKKKKDDDDDDDDGECVIIAK
jgi:hypothetical protein